jgi:FAD:protein FMN transferase
MRRCRPRECVASRRARRAAPLALLFAGTAIYGQQLLRLEKSADAMGATFTIALYGADRASSEAAVDAALAESQRLDGLLSNYRPGSEWSTVNRSAANRPVKLSPELFDLLSCLDYSRRSDGAFDITVGPLMKVWGFYKSSGHLAPKSEVEASLRRIGYRHINLDAKVWKGPRWNRQRLRRGPHGDDS